MTVPHLTHAKVEAMTDDRLAELQINRKDIPLTDADKRHLITWCRQMADEMERGEHWGSWLFVLGPSKPPSTNGRHLGGR